MPPPRGTLHHIELWVADLAEAEASWGWLLRRLGYERADQWENGQSWALGATYVVLDAGPDRVDARRSVGGRRCTRAGCMTLTDGSDWAGGRGR